MTHFYHTVDILGITIVVSAFFVAFIYPPLMMRRATRQSCISLARAVESREPYQLGHSEKTAALLVAMARRSMKLFPWQIRDLEIAALLHMVGKVGVPHALLNSPIPPTGSKLFAVREYVRIGAEILAAVPPLRGGAAAVQFHREYIDGTGYPFGRFGESIPFGSRLLCVATEFIAMTSERIYRPHGNVMTTEEALDYFAQRVGMQYDAEAVELLIKVCSTPRRPPGDVRAPMAGRLGAAAK